jgi:hypothetical protein
MSRWVILIYIWFDDSKKNTSPLQAIQAYSVGGKLKIPHCLDNRLTDGGVAVNLKHCPPSTPHPPSISVSDIYFC